MSKKIAKKTIILYVLKMLTLGASKEKPITSTNMAKVLNSMEIPCNRKTVSRNVNYLIDFGYPIVKLTGGGLYIDKETSKFSIQNSFYIILW